MPHEVAPKTSANIGLKVEDVADVSVAALFIGYGLYNLGNNDNRSKNQSKTWKKPVQIMH